MHRNTYLLISALAIFAAVVVGINIGKSLQSRTPPTSQTPTAQVTPTALPTIALNTYTNTTCGVSIQYPSTLTKMEASGSALFIDSSQNKQSVALTCQKDIPRPPLLADKIETLFISNQSGTASISAKLYHDSSPKDGSPIDALIFRNPRNGLDVFVSGFGEVFQQIVLSLTLL